MTIAGSAAHGQAGVALIVVLWGCALLTVLVLGLTALVRGQMLTVRQSVHAAQARALAEAGIQRALAELLIADRSERWRADGSEHTLEFADGIIRVAIQDVSGLVDISAAREELIDGVLAATGVDAARRPALRDAILDWRDADNLHRLYGAEDDAYHAAGREYGAADAAFSSVEELRQVMGMDGETYQRLVPVVTVYSGRVGVNPEWAPEPVLRSLPGLTADAASAYLSARAERLAGTQALPLLGVEKRFLGQQSGDVYRITSAAVAAGETRVTIVATVRLRPNATRPYKVLSWRE